MVKNEYSKTFVEYSMNFTRKKVAIDSKKTLFQFFQATYALFNAFKNSLASCAPES
jgi:hypothetical protein